MQETDNFYHYYQAVLDFTSYSHAAYFVLLSAEAALVHLRGAASSR
jgi:hypothetical protein